MTLPVILPRAEHVLSRTMIDPDALKVLYRLHQHGYAAYLVGGSVRDLLLGRRPKDFDLGTSAHPYQVKHLFRNCWIIGRRFRLAHVRFGQKTIEVATFRRKVAPDELDAGRAGGEPGVAGDAPDRLMHRDNTFGTAEEDAFRRDFTINALFYDIATFSIIDYTGGLGDLRDGLIRSIGDAEERFQEDPVRMLRAVALAARLDFRIDPAIDRAIALNRGAIARSAPARLMEECYKVLRSGVSERTFRMLAERRLLEPLAPVLQGGDARLWQALSELDGFRRRFVEPPASLTNAILLGSLLVGVDHPAVTPGPPAGDDSDDEQQRSLGLLPLARGDVERLRQVLGLQRRLLDMTQSPRARRALVHRAAFHDALTWLEIHGRVPDVLEHWRGFVEAAGTYESEAAAGVPPRRRRRRRRRRRPNRNRV
jgi:poly(A) polymerase